MAAVVIRVCQSIRQGAFTTRTRRPSARRWREKGVLRYDISPIIRPVHSPPGLRTNQPPGNREAYAPSSTPRITVPGGWPFSATYIQTGLARPRQLPVELGAAIDLFGRHTG